MTLSSKFTYLLPILVLLLPCYWYGGLFVSLLFYKFDFNGNYGLLITLQIAMAIAVAALFYFGFVKLSHKVKPIVFKIIIVILPAIPMLIWGWGSVPLLFMLVPGLLFLLAFILFNNRYTATLTDRSIVYKNLLGHQGEIPLEHVISLEQKKNILGFVTRYGRILDISRKTSIGFRNESLDEFEITLYARAFQHNQVFNRIIDSTNRAGNLKVRQYSF